MTQKDESPEASEGPYWSEELLAVLVVGLGDETQARETLEGIIQQALSGKALQGISEEALASYLSKLYERIAESVQDSDVARRRSLTKKVEVVTEAARKAVAAAYTELSEELLEERVAMAEELAQKQRELKAAWERSDATVRVAASLEQAKEAAEVEKKKASAAAYSQTRAPRWRRRRGADVREGMDPCGKIQDQDPPHTDARAIRRVDVRRRF